MRQYRRPSASIPSRPRAGSVRRAVSTLAALALLAAGCVSDPAAPASGDARLALTAHVGSATADALQVTMFYLRTGGSAPLLDVTVPLANATPGTTVTQPIAVELAACLADPTHLPGGDSCSVVTTVRLLEGGRVLDELTLEPMVVRPGEAVVAPQFALSEVNDISIAAGGSTTIYPGTTLALTAQPTGRGGEPVAGRTVTWSSATPGVATVDAATGIVTAVTPGTAVIRASIGALPPADITVTVVHRPQFELAASAVSFSAGQGDAAPDEQRILVGMTGAPTLDGLAVAGIDYAGAQAGWLSATLAQPTAPTTLVLRPTRTTLPPGTYTATVTLTAPVAQPRTVTVTYQVTPSITLDVSPSQLFFASSGEVPESQSFAVTASAGISGPMTASIEYFNPTRDWVGLVVDSTRAGTTWYTVTPDPIALAGAFEADIVLTAPGATRPTRVRVRYDVSPDYSDYWLFLEPEYYYESDVAFGDSLQITPWLYGPNENAVSGVPITFTSSDPSMVRLSPSTVPSGQPMWVHPTGNGTGQVAITGSLHGLTDTLYIWVYEGGEESEPAPRIVRPRQPGAPNLRVQPPRPPARVRVPRTPSSAPEQP